MTSKINNIINVPDIKVPGQSTYFHEQDWDLILEQYINSQKKLFSQPNSPSPQSGQTINDFFFLIKNALISRQDSEGVPENHRVLFEEEESPEEIDTEAITFEIIKREPGDFGRGPIGQAKVKEITSHYRSEIKDPGRPGERLITMGKFYTNWITFYINARTNKKARERLLWFEDIMEGFRWYFGLYGFRQVIYIGTNKRESFKSGELKLTRYPVTYAVRTDDIYHINRQELRKLVIEPTVSH